MQFKLSELWDFGEGNTFQNRSVSSPAPVTMVCPSGEIARYNTLYVWPVKVASLDIVGYLQTIIWFWEYPWVLTSSFTFFDHTRLQTWLPVSTQLKCVFVVVFQNRMHLSAVPPPDASRPWRWGDQAIALTAAVCSVYFSTGCTECGLQTKS